MVCFCFPWSFPVRLFVCGVFFLGVFGLLPLSPLGRQTGNGVPPYASMIKQKKITPVNGLTPHPVNPPTTQPPENRPITLAAAVYKYWPASRHVSSSSYPSHNTKHNYNTSLKQTPQSICLISVLLPYPAFSIELPCQRTNHPTLSTNAGIPPSPQKSVPSLWPPPFINTGLRRVMFLHPIEPLHTTPNTITIPSNKHLNQYV